MGRKRLLIIGLDCVPPSLVFGRMKMHLPTLNALMQRGYAARLHSSDPPITVPAWACLTSGRDPGELGVYGFHRRDEGSYDERLCDSTMIRSKRIWDWASDAGLQAAALFVPLTSPVQALRGHMVSCFMRGEGGNEWTYPAALASELEPRFGPYIDDVHDFRGGDRARIYREICDSTDQHFEIANYIWKEKNPDVMMLVEMGPDRLHHAFWRDLDPEHPLHDPRSEWVELCKEYYQKLDRHVERLIGDANDINVIIASDHGAKSMLGSICINDWLIREGWLVLKENLEGVTRLSADMVDWQRTRAWARGGYCARVFVNLFGREPHGIVLRSELPQVLNDLQLSIESMTTKIEGISEVEVRQPRDHYKKVRGTAPDLIVYFNDLFYRALGTVGHSEILIADDDRGIDYANHDWDGVLIMAGPQIRNTVGVQRASIYDVAPTSLQLMGLEVPSDLRGASLLAG